MLTRRSVRGGSNLVESLSEPPSGGAVSTWVGGVVVPLAAAAYGISVFVTQQATLIGGRPTRLIPVTGPTALWLGVCWLAAAVFAHAHWFWSWRERWHGYGELGKLIAAIAGVIGLVGTCIAFLAFS